MECRSHTSVGAIPQYTDTEHKSRITFNCYTKALSTEYSVTAKIPTVVALQ